MSSTAGTPFDVSASPTRQQLDELDALMQRMLALPVLPETHGAETEGRGRSASDSPGYHADPESFDFGPFAREARPFTSAAPVAPDPSTHRATIDPHFDFAALAEPPRIVAPSQTMVEISSSGVVLVESPLLPSEPTPGILTYPLLKVDRLFVILTMAFGPLGAFLRSRAGRNLLGSLGVLLLLIAGVWCVLDGIGWTW